MQQNTSIGNLFAFSERAQEGLDFEVATDPESGAAFLQSDGHGKHDDLKRMLDSSKDSLKLDAMKRIISMIARGRDASELFPAVVKNVVSKNIEVKKLVYVYLVRYAEEQQDLALLSISTFQRALKDPNQLIRASALRVLSSIRVHMIVPIVMLAIQESSADLSPYVRKTAAHAIPKLYSLDPDQKGELVSVIEKLLSDRTTLVVGSTVMAFDEVCPERVDLIHKNYRKLCNLLVDVDEWGQVIIINMLTRYARTQFIDPNLDGENDTQATNHSKSNCESPHSESDEGVTSKQTGAMPKRIYTLDLDHRLLLRSTKPLLQSRNSSVVMAVAQLYHYLAPNNEVHLIAKALIRFLRSYKEVQSVVLACIASISMKRKSVFEPHIKSFFVRAHDSTHIKQLKLNILTNLASSANIAIVLREFQTYISSFDRSFVAATIQAIGRCAASINEVTESCLSGLVHLLSNHDENVVAESIIVIKTLMQGKDSGHKEIIVQMTKLIDFITVPAARAAIIWLIGEYNETVDKIAPDVLRKMAKTFSEEDLDVKLQILNLGVKLYLVNPEQTSLLCQYVFSMARFDTNYDVRDRARFLRQFIFPVDSKQTILSKNARKIFLSPKPIPASVNEYRDNSFQLGSLSHYLNMRANGYREVPSFATERPDPKVRNIEGFMYESTIPATSIAQEKANVKNDEATTKKLETENITSDSASSSNGSGSGSDSDTSEGSPSFSGASKSKAAAQQQSTVQTATLVDASIGMQSSHTNYDGTSDSESSSSYTSKSSTTGDNESDSAHFVAIPNNSTAQIESETKSETNVAKKNLDLLLDLEDIPSITPVMTPSLGGFLTPVAPMANMQTLKPHSVDDLIELISPSYIQLTHKELVNKMSGHGLQINYRFTRAPHLYSSKMASIELQFINSSNTEVTDIRIGTRALPTGAEMNNFSPIMSLLPQQMTTSIIGIDFNDSSSQSVDFEIESSAGKSRLTLKPTIGELLRAIKISESFFRDQRMKLRGMNEHQSQQYVNLDSLSADACKRTIFENLNVSCILDQRLEDDAFLLDFAGETLSSKSLVLTTVKSKANGLEITVNCEKLVIGSMVLNELRNILAKFH